MLVLFHFRYSQDYWGYSGEGKVLRISEHITQRVSPNCLSLGSVHSRRNGRKRTEIARVWGQNCELLTELHCRHLSSWFRQQQTWWAGHCRTYFSLLPHWNLSSAEYTMQYECRATKHWGKRSTHERVHQLWWEPKARPLTEGKDSCSTPYLRTWAIFQTERCQLEVPCAAEASRGQAGYASGRPVLLPRPWPHMRGFFCSSLAESLTRTNTSRSRKG